MIEILLKAACSMYLYNIILFAFPNSLTTTADADHDQACGKTIWQGTGPTGPPSKAATKVSKWSGVQVKRTAKHVKKSLVSLLLRGRLGDAISCHRGKISKVSPMGVCVDVGGLSRCVYYLQIIKRVDVTFACKLFEIKKYINHKSSMKIKLWSHHWFSHNKNIETRSNLTIFWQIFYS
jgi:hypothetical protein